MKITKLNKTHNVFKQGNAKWQATFYTGEAYMKAIVQMYESFGPGMPYTNRHTDNEHDRSWMFRNMDPSVLRHENTQHRIYLTTEEQITLLGFSYEASD
jgi:hypothetical protein